MSKKRKNFNNTSVSTSTTDQASVYDLHGSEYRFVKSDLLKVLYINFGFLVLVLSLYFYDQKTGILLKIYNSLL